MGVDVLAPRLHVRLYSFVGDNQPDALVPNRHIVPTLRLVYQLGVEAS